MILPGRPLLVLAALSLLALAVGSVPLGWREVVGALAGQPGEQAAIVLELRLPRALAGFACGALLALAGSLMQVLLRNPLADPYVLGISGGASVGALLAMLLGLGAFGIAGLAFGGALGVMLLVFGLAHGDGSWTQSRLLLTGVVAAGCGALVALILTLAPEGQIHGMLFWLMGDLSQALDARPALAVSTAGAIGFVGLIVPHLTRLALGAPLGNDQRLLLPAVALAGGSLLTLADTLARTVAAPVQLPVGVLTAIIGVPVFLFLLARSGRP